MKHLHIHILLISFKQWREQYKFSLISIFSKFIFECMKGIVLLDLYFYRPQTKFAKVMILQVSVSHSVHRGGMCGCSGGVRGCSWGDMCGCSGGVRGCSQGSIHGCSRELCGCSRRACVVAPGGTCVVALGGHVWLLPGDMHGCSLGEACMGYDEIRRYDQ